MYEVEQKYRVDEPDTVISRLQECGATASSTVRQTDTYYAHPARDFRSTDEALRIRTIDNTGPTSDQTRVITYKGPKIDSSTKTRREIEIPLADDSAGQFRAMLLALGFTPAVEVHKNRRYYSLDWQEYEVEVAIDAVDQLGHFIELEIVAAEEHLDSARAAIASLATKLSLVKTELRGYADLIEQNSQDTTGNSSQKRST